MFQANKKKDQSQKLVQDGKAYIKYLIGFVHFLLKHMFADFLVTLKN